jgi:hypothetical protein
MFLVLAKPIVVSEAATRLLAFVPELFGIRKNED